MFVARRSISAECARAPKFAVDFFSRTMAMRSAPALSSRPPHARNSHARVAFNESLARRCADHRAKKAEDHGYLFYSAHSGWGNQQVALGQAITQVGPKSIRRTNVLHYVHHGS